MRAKIIFSLSVVVGLGLFSLPVFAQDESQANANAEIQELSSHQELNLNDDKTLIIDTDAKPAKVTPTVRDTPSASQGNNAKKLEQQKSSGSSGDKTQEDPLSFNFLYYIIQKFKISDIVDE